MSCKCLDFLFLFFQVWYWGEGRARCSNEHHDTTANFHMYREKILRNIENQNNCQFFGLFVFGVFDTVMMINGGLAGDAWICVYEFMWKKIKTEN